MNHKTPRWITVLLWIFAAMYLANGIEMFFIPSVWFYRIVPGVPETGPFNAHLVADSEDSTDQGRPSECATWKPAACACR